MRKFNSKGLEHDIHELYLILDNCQRTVFGEREQIVKQFDQFRKLCENELPFEEVLSQVNDDLHDLIITVAFFLRKHNERQPTYIPPDAEELEIVK